LRFSVRTWPSNSPEQGKDLRLAKLLLVGFAFIIITLFRPSLLFKSKSAG
jgi:hypothetical protein